MESKETVGSENLKESMTKKVIKTNESTNLICE